MRVRQIIEKNNKNIHHTLFVFLLLLTGFFLLLEISFFIQCNKAYFADFTFVSSHLHIPVAIMPGILFFLFAQVAVHFVFCFLIFALVYLIANFFRLTEDCTLWLALALWLFGLITVLTLNQFFYPNSKFSGLTTLILFNPTIVNSFLIVSAISWSVVIMLAFVALLKRLFMSSRLGLGLIGCAGILYFILPMLFTATPSSVATKKFPNVIIVGVDSLRPDFLSFFGYDKNRPFFDAFLSQAVVFNEAVTPLARTFPSWAGILTGQYPREIGIRSNLSNHSYVKLENTLPAILRQHGYETVFATDETRFSNIDESFGFDRIISPPMGLNDFLIGNFNDFPLSNLLINTSIGKWLFPYSYANRPVFTTYNPDSFLNLLSPIFKQTSEKPLFLAVHFCLTHYPYLWSSLPANQYSIWERYEHSIQRVDAQLSDFFILMQKAHLLDHAIVVLLSDHGEALEFPGDRITEPDLFFSANKIKPIIPKFYPPSLDDEAMNQSAGHGTDVLGLPQYHTLLAFKLYGLNDWHPGEFSGVVSLLDIKPTLLGLLNLPATHSSGKSLVNVIRGHERKPSAQAVFLESDFSPEAIRTVYPETRKVLLEGIQLFQIDPITTRLTVKPTMSKMIIHSKQYAAIDGDWMLALYPQNENFRLPILINLRTGVWTNNLQSTFARSSPALQLLEKLNTFYKNDIQ